MGLMGNAQPMAGADSERLFAAGVACICCETWPMAYVCFERSAREDAPTRYNQALCCFHVEWYEESYRLLAESERLLDIQSAGISGPGVTSAPRRQLPEAFRRWDTDGELPLPGAFAGSCPAEHGRTAVRLLYHRNRRLQCLYGFPYGSGNRSGL